MCSFENADKHSSDFSVHIFDATLGGMQHERVTVGNHCVDVAACNTSV